MANYHLYSFENGQLIGSEGIDAADDAEAVRIAGERGGGDIVEVWNGDGRLRILKPDGARRKAVGEPETSEAPATLG